VLVGLVGFLLAACTCLPKGQADLDVGMKERGIASWYGRDFNGWLTASGETYNMEALTGAHRTLPLGTVVRVTNVENGKQVRVRINDRGPYVNGRIIDLSHAAAEKLGMTELGISAVSLEVIGSHGGHLLAGADGRSLTTLHEYPESPARRHAARGTRGLPLFPGDLLRERRARRVAELLADDHLSADDHWVSQVASLYVP
jgi:rare lipoprotein A